MKNQNLIIFTIVFFLLINSSYYWEGKLGFFAIPTFLILLAAFCGLTIALLRQLYFALREKFRDHSRWPFIGVLVIILSLTYYKPDGVIDFDKLAGRDVLVAEREGAANCLTILKLKDDFTFRERVGCFGTFETKGRFRIVNDTIYFENIKSIRQKKDYFKFAVIKPTEFDNSKILGDLIMYKSSNDTVPFGLWITKNELHKLNANSRTANIGFAAMLADK